ncbi:MAG: helix-turn-helix domain-containing protein [Azoarcus sp.]|jgi:transcriptional regulator with XRE-family HTH domain|nr:helix-turn-helix domain-containing protein [Azoarcus sp.]
MPFIGIRDVTETAIVSQHNLFLHGSSGLVMSKDIARRIGRNIAETRKAAGRTQAEVAEKVGIDTVSISRIERGIVTPSLTTLNKIADGLDVALNCLFEGASSNTAALTDNIVSQLKPLNDADRLFLLEQLQAWSKKLSDRKIR